MRRFLAAVGVAACLIVLPAKAAPAEAAGITYNHFYWGQCTWWAAQMRPDIGAVVWGNAWNWLGSAHAAGLPIGYTPKVGAIAVYQPGVEGAWSAGHVAHVIAVSPDGVHFTVDEMHFPFVGVVDHRVSHTAPGVGFIY